MGIFSDARGAKKSLRLRENFFTPLYFPPQNVKISAFLAVWAVVNGNRARRETKQNYPDYNLQLLIQEDPSQIRPCRGLDPRGQPTPIHVLGRVPQRLCFSRSRERRYLGHSFPTFKVCCMQSFQFYEGSHDAGPLLRREDSGFVVVDEIGIRV